MLSAYKGINFFAKQLLREFARSNYVKVAHYPGYDAELVARDVIDTDLSTFFRHRTLGLLTSQNSRSGNLALLQYLAHQGIEGKNLTIHRYRRHYDLHCALERSEVDVISTYATEKFRQGPRVTVATDLPGLSWYWKKERLYNAKFYCAFQAAISRLTQYENNIYWKSLTWDIPPCPD